MNKTEYLQKVDGEIYLTIEEASAELGIKSTAIRNYLHDQKLTKYKFKNMTLLHRNEVIQWKNRQRKRKADLS